MSENPNETVNETTGELVVRNPESFTVDQLASITDMETLTDLFAAEGIETAEDIADYGSGFVLLENKNKLVGVPFVIAEWRWNRSETYDQDFASIHLFTSSGDKFIINDGSVKAGIAAQLRDVQAKRRAQGNERNAQRGLKVVHGLSRSDYKEQGKPGDENYRPAGTTYFLATSPVK